MKFNTYSVTEDLDEKSLYLSILKTRDLDEKSLYLSILKTRDADMISSASTNRNNKSILAVDDENSVVDIIKQSLQKQEFKVCSFRSIQSFSTF